MSQELVAAACQDFAATGTLSTFLERLKEIVSMAAANISQEEASAILAKIAAAGAAMATGRYMVALFEGIQAAKMIREALDSPAAPAPAPA